MRALIVRAVAITGRWAASRRRSAVALGTAGLLAASAGCGGMAAPTTDMSLGQTVMELTDAVNALRDESSIMQAQIDSLRTVVARQDSTIVRLSNLAGGGLPPR